MQFVCNYSFHDFRVAYLYGIIKPDNTVKVEFIYEPPQECTDVYFQLLDNVAEVSAFLSC